MLQCSKCKEWKEEVEFHPSHRLGRTRRYGYFCKECDNQRNRDLRKERLEIGVCTFCGKTHDTSNRMCPECLGGAKSVREQLKVAALSAYGGPVCAYCGENHSEFLCIDHIHGGGNEHRKEVGSAGGPFYQWLKNNNYPDGYQVLCMNCNHAKDRCDYSPYGAKIDFFNLKIEGGVVIG